MVEPTDVPDQPTELSLVQGGPLFQLFLRARLVGPPMDLLARRIVVVSGVAWLPLLLLTVLSGNATGGLGPFFYDLGAHVRLLLCVPLLLSAEVVVHQRITKIVRQFLDQGLLAPEDQPRFQSFIASALRLRNSVLAEVLLLGITIVVGSWFGNRYVAKQTATWFAVPIGDQMQPTVAGYWYFFVSLTILRFLFCRWYFRLFVWYRFLWQVARHIPLRLNALHPDRAGGLGFLAYSAFAFASVLLAHTIGLAGILGGKIWHDGATLPQFKVEIATWILFLITLVLSPLVFFVVQLAHAKRTGLREYDRLASQYVDDFRQKWINGQPAKAAALVGTADIQSLADLSNSFKVVEGMRLVPFGKEFVLKLAILTVLPLAPLTLTMIPLDQLIDRALSIFL